MPARLRLSLALLICAAFVGLLAWGRLGPSRRSAAPTAGMTNADCRQCHAAVFEEWETSYHAKAFRDEDRPAAYVARRGHEFWVCHCSEYIVGFVDWQGDFVNALHVRGSYSRSGVGSRLMDKAEAEIRKSGFTAARLETDTFNRVSQQFYAKRGYTEADRYPDTEWDSDLVTILLVKALQ